MRTSKLFPAVLSCLLAVPASAFPPAPYYRIFGTIRNEQGRPLAPGEGSVILSGIYSGLGTANVSGGSVTDVSILSGGTGFTSTPSVSFVGADGAGSGASAVAILSDGVVTGINLTGTGSGYSAPVMVGFSGGGSEPLEVVRSITTAGDGSNYALSVPMDSGITTKFYDLSAMRPFLPFTLRVVIDGVNHVPMQIAAAPAEFWRNQIDSVNSPGINSQGNHWAVGLPSDKLRLDLTLGVDSDGDGLPDSWERVILDSLGLDSLDDVTPGGDSDGDGVSNMTEYLAGTYAFDSSNKFALEIVEVMDVRGGGDREKVAHLRFLAIAGRTYRILELVSAGELVPREFSIEPGSTDTIGSIQADEVTEQDVYLKSSDGGSRIFVLSVD